MVFDCKPDSGFRMLQADSYSRPVSHSLAVQHAMPDQATVAAVDRKGRALFLAPEPETFGPERNMYTAVQYNLGQSPAGIVQGNLRQTCRDDISSSATREDASRPSSSMAMDQSSRLSASALPAAEIDPMAGQGSWVGSAVDPPQTTARSQGGALDLGSKCSFLQLLTWLY